MLDHISLSVSNMALARAFYEKALGPLGYSVHADLGDTIGMGSGGTTDLWLVLGGKPNPHVHLAFRVEARKLVDDFHSAAIAAGGVDNGKPGLRPHYHEHYYGAFVIDPDGNNIEAVCHRKQ